MRREPTLDDRLKMRERPDGLHVMHQDWHNVLFLHWEVPHAEMRRLIPEPVAIDTFDGKAWLTVTPLTITNVRPPAIPPLPYVSWLCELNVRTYVHLDGVPGIWFFSLDANNLLAVLGARIFFSLPYFNAEMTCDEAEGRINFSSKRKEGEAEFAAAWTIGKELPPAEPGSLEFFLAERYCLYTSEADAIYRCQIHHRPWPLQEAENLRVSNCSVIAGDDISSPTAEPIAHCGGPVYVDVWAPERVAG
jgi:uncharacterized protein YqjF (DUF2071 family)